MLQSLAKIGVLRYALIPALSGVNMGFVQNVEESTKHKTMKHASLLSKLAVEKDLVQATQTAEAAILEGPKALPQDSLKHHAIDKFEALLEDHPNQPFVRSVMQGLREGFWPFDEGDWKNDQNDLSDNFATLPEDLAAIRSFRDKELQAERWSSPLPISGLLPGMKFSPMFVVWQHNKPRVVTDHSSSGLNNGIPKSEGHVSYDDMLLWVCST